MPFLTEEIWTQIPLTQRETPSLVKSQWPTADRRFRDEDATLRLDRVTDVITAVRTIRGQNGISPNLGLNVVVSTPDETTKNLIEDAVSYLAHLAKVEDLAVSVHADRPARSAVAVAGSCTVYVPLEGIVDIEAEVARLEKAVAKLQKEIARLNGKLSNERFIANAPPEVVQKDRSRLSEAGEQLGIYSDTITHLNA